MNKIGGILKGHENLSDELMNDKSFVDEAKKIFEESNLEFSEDTLREILEDTEGDLEKAQNLSEEDLSEVIGGVGVEGGSTKSGKSRAGAIAIKVTTTILGTAIGGAIGMFLGTEWKWEKGNGITSAKSTALPGVVGAATGNVVGFRLGKLISEKLGLEEVKKNTENTPEGDDMGIDFNASFH